MNKLNELKKYETYEITLSNYDRYIKTIINKYYNIENILKDDLYQECAIALYNAYINYNEDNSSTFHSYAVTCIVNALHTYVNHNCSVIRRPIKLIKKHININFISTSAPLGNDTNTNIEDTIEDYVEDSSIDDQETAQRVAVMNYLSNLKVSYQNIIRMHLIEEMNFVEIAEALNTSRQNVQKKYQLGLNKLKMFYFNNNNN
jgi:RNA polymerase sigma factor (sigma-70 family)